MSIQVVQTGQAAEVTVVASRGATGATGATGAAGPNTITTATTSNLTGFISANGTNVSGATEGTTAATPSTVVLRDATGGTTFSGIVTAPRITGRCDGLEVLCKAGLAINAGQVVYVTGASGNNIIIGLAQANAEVTSSKTIGISESTLANNATGYAITEGLMTVSISAPAAVEGDPIWLSPSTAGGMVFGVANKPSAPNHIVYLGVVTRKTGNTVVEIYVKIQNGAELDELADVAITSPVAGQALIRGASLWENRSIVATDISDSTTAGRSLLTAADAAEQRTSLGLGTLATQSGTFSGTSSGTNTGDLLGVIVTKANGTRTSYAPSADTDTARGLALEAAFAAAVAGDTIDLSPGNYYVAKSTSTIAGIVSQYAILDGMTIRLNGARLYKKSTDTASCMFAVNATSLIDDWSIIGPGILDGSYAANSDTAARGAATAEIGINNFASRRCRIEGLTFKNFAGTGIQSNNATFVSDEYGGSGAKYSTGHIHSCNADLNNVGLKILSGNEYWSISNSSFNKNLTGCDIYAGNIKFLGCEANGNTNFALRIRDGGNDGHGTWVGGTMNHNLGFSVSIEANMDNGFTFAGSHFFGDSTTTNKIQSLGGGATFTGCIINSPFFASATPTGINTVKDSFFEGTYAAVTDLSAAERAKWKFVNNHTLTGVFASDDIRTTYATDAAAGTGGVLQGELWQQTTTGAIFAKL